VIVDDGRTPGEEPGLRPKSELFCSNEQTVPRPPESTLSDSEAKSRMWLLFILNLLNAAANNKTLVLQFRFEVWGFPINIFDVLLAVLSIGILLQRRSTYFKVDRVPLVFMVVAAGLLLALLMGGALSFGNDTTVRNKLNETRNFATLPITFIAGYMYLRRPRSAAWLSYIYVLAGIASATMILLYFSGRAEADEHSLSNINALRAVNYISNYAGIAAAFLLFCLVAGVNIFPLPVTLLLMVFCFAGQMATLSRSDWIAQITAMIAALLLVPRGKRVRGIVVTLVALPLLYFATWGAVALVSQTTGVDFASKLMQKFNSLFISSDTSISQTAYGSRLPGIEQELTLWSSSPLIGKGFAIQEQDFVKTGQHIMSYRHCAWTSFLAETGIIGFSMVLAMLIATFVIGRRMIRERVDRGSILMGALGCVTAVYAFFIGLTTMSINNLRGAIWMGIVCGAVVRTRAMQLTTKRFWEAYLPEGAMLAGGEHQLVLLDEDPLWAGAGQHQQPQFSPAEADPAGVYGPHL
jgi:hypothetical protein